MLCVWGHKKTIKQNILKNSDIQILILPFIFYSSFKSSVPLQHFKIATVRSINSSVRFQLKKMLQLDWLNNKDGHISYLLSKAAEFLLNCVRGRLNKTK